MKKNWQEDRKEEEEEEEEEEEGKEENRRWKKTGRGRRWRGGVQSAE